MPDLMSPGPLGYTILAECVAQHVRLAAFSASDRTDLVELSNNQTSDNAIATHVNQPQPDLEYNLYISPWSPCNSVCGGGQQARVASCIYGTVVVDMSLCGDILREEAELGLELIKPCNYVPCVTDDMDHQNGTKMSREKVSILSQGSTGTHH